MSFDQKAEWRQSIAQQIAALPEGKCRLRALVDNPWHDKRVRHAFEAKKRLGSEDVLRVCKEELELGGVVFQKTTVSSGHFKIAEAVSTPNGMGRVTQLREGVVEPSAYDELLQQIAWAQPTANLRSVLDGHEGMETDLLAALVYCGTVTATQIAEAHARLQQLDEDGYDRAIRAGLSREPADTKAAGTSQPPGDKHEQ